MKKLKELSFFETLLETPQNALVDKAIEEGRVPVGYNCYQIPEPLLSVGKAFPVRLRAPGLADTQMADIYLSSILCGLSRSILEQAMDGTYSFLGGLVGSPQCTHIRRAHQHLELLDLFKDNEKFFFEFVNAPQKKGDEASIDYTIRSYKKIAQKMNEKYGIDVSDEQLKKAIIQFNQFNQIIKEISDLRKEANPKITGTEFQTVYVSSKVAPKDMLVEQLGELKNKLDERSEIKDYRARVMVVGSVWDDPKFSEIIEEQGALIVCDRVCFGSHPGLEPIKVDGDPWENLARYYTDTSMCARFLGALDSRINYILKLAAEFKVDGIIFEHIKFCEFWGYESITAVTALREAGIPVVVIERDYAPTSEGQLRTRVQAFIESIEYKKIAK